MSAVLAWSAVGDALGVPYEDGPPTDADPVMSGGGLGDYAPGEWSDDTQLALVLADAATRTDLRTDDGLREVATGLVAWLASGPADIGTQTRAALFDARRAGDPLAGARDGARRYAADHRMSAGNGALMRTAVLGVLGYDRDDTARVAEQVAALTHVDADGDVRDTVVLWTELVRSAVAGDALSRLDPLAGLDLVPDDVYDGWSVDEPVSRHDLWRKRIHDAVDTEPHRIPASGGSVGAMLRAWSAIVRSDLDPVAALTTIARSGGDTDSVAAIAGGLLGALYPASDIPEHWRIVHGWAPAGLGGRLGLDGLVALESLRGA